MVGYLGLFCFHKWRKSAENIHHSNVTTINYRCVKCGKVKHSVVSAPYSDGGYTIHKLHNKKIKTVMFSDSDGDFKVKKWNKKKRKY
jgi:hypothetical protein